LTRTHLMGTVNNFHSFQVTHCVSFICYRTTRVTSMAYRLAGFNGQRPAPINGYYHLDNGYRSYSLLLGTLWLRMD